MNAVTHFVGVWPLLSELVFDADALAGRKSCIGGSDANTILSGDNERIRRLWQEKRGEVESEDLSRVLPVQMGVWTEQLQRQWFQRETGRAVEYSGKSFRCTVNPWRSATVDGITDDGTAVWEAKHVNAFAKPDEVLAKYMPQLQHNMAVTGLSKAVLSMFLGTFKWEVFEVDADWLYQEDLLAAEVAFWNAVQTGDQPCTAAVPDAPKPTSFREVSMQGNNRWAVCAIDWLDNRDAAKSFKTSEAAIKELVEADVSKAVGHGIIVKRSKAGALTISEGK